MERLFTTLVMAGSVLAATAYADNSATIIIQGTVPASADLAIAPVAGYNALNILSGVNNQSVATVTEKSNGANGYTVTLQSANAHALSSSQPTLNGAGANAAKVPYSITYNNQPVTLDGTGSAIVTSTTVRSSAAGVQKSLNVTIGQNWVGSDTYSDTLVLTLKNN